MDIPIDFFTVYMDIVLSEDSDFIHILCQHSQKLIKMIHANN